MDGDPRLERVCEEVRRLGGDVVASQVYASLCRDPAWRHTYGTVVVDLSRLVRARRLESRAVQGDEWGRDALAFSAPFERVEASARPMFDWSRGVALEGDRL